MKPTTRSSATRVGAKRSSARRANAKRASAKRARAKRPSVEPAARRSGKAASAPTRLAEYRSKRDFSRTAEPRGAPRKAARTLAYVIQKHAASHLHFDLRLELDGVMKSWAVPKGPSLDPAVKRLAMQVEDHPIEYNQFEGTIPKGEYGGGTVMIWDRGTYEYGGSETDADPIDALRRGYAKGDFKFVLHGDRLTGSWVLVRTRRGDARRPQWLLIKHRDEAAEPGSEVIEEYLNSAPTRRTKDEIAAGPKPPPPRG
jgi:bifunctional non-homologous end joining protein LigD